MRQVSCGLSAVIVRERRTPLDENAIRRMLRLYNIESDKLRISSLPQGDDNLSLLVSVPGGRYVLRLYRTTPREEITFELELVHFLAGRHFPTPRVHRRTNGGFVADVNGLPAALFDVADGHLIDETDPGDVGRIAALFARMHVLTSGVTFRGRRVRTDAGRLGRFDELAATNPRLAQTRGVDDFLVSVRSVLADWETALRSSDGPVPVGPIHHDPSPGNILIDHAGEITALLDFDEAYLGPLVLDIAALLHYWALDRTLKSPDPLRPDRVRQLIRGYERLRRLTMAERSLLPAALLVFSAADAAEYLTRWWLRNPTGVNLDESLSLVSFRALRETTDWQQQLNREFADTRDL